MAQLSEDLRSAGIDGAEREAFWLVEAVTGYGRAEVVASRPLVDPAQVRSALDLAARRGAGEPLQYITGVAGFRMLELSVGPGVLIPRPETEVVAGRAMDLLPQGGTLVDVGTGSGAIALAVAHERKDARVVATESSDEAVRWAQTNKQRLNLDIQLVHCDLFARLPRHLAGTVDVVVSNPPYVADSEAASLPIDVIEHEPHEALFAGSNGLSVIRRLISEARVWLRPQGWLVLEIAADSGADVAEDLTQHDYRHVSISPDLSGRERVAEGQRGA